MSERKFGRRDFLRLLGIGAAGAGVAVVGSEVAKVKKRLDQGEAAMSTLEARQEENIVGDCVNENVLRMMNGIEPTSLEGCKDERKAWRDSMNSATPQKPTKPQEGQNG